MMKKMLAMILALVMSLSLVACGGGEDAPADDGADAPEVEEAVLKTVTDGVLTVATSPDFAPYEFYAIDANGEPQLAGFDMALAQYIADYLGLTLEVVPMSFNGIVGEMGAGVADLALAGLSPDPKRENAMDFSDIYYEGKQAFITVSDKAGLFTDLASTNSAEFSIGAQTGTIQMDLAQQYSPDADIVTLTKATDIIAELVSGKLDGGYVEWDVAVAYQANYPELTIVCEVPYEAEGNVIGVKKGNADLLKYVNEALHKCINEGTFAQFVKEANELSSGNTYEGILDPDGKVPTTNEG